MDTTPDTLTSQLISAQLDATPVPMIAIGKTGRITGINTAFTDQFGWEPDELIGQDQLIFQPAGRTENFSKRLDQLEKTGRCPSLECRRLHKNGSEIDVEITFGSFAPLLKAAGDVEEATAYFQLWQDRSETAELELELMRYRAEMEELVKRPEPEVAIRLNQLINQSPQAIIEWDENFCVASWNQAAERIFGYTAEEAIGQHATHTLEEEVWPHVDQIWQHLMSLEGGEHSVNRNVRKDGEIILCEWFNKTLTDDDGRPTGVLSFVSDITEKSRAEAQIQYQANLLMYTSDAIIAADADFVVQSWNRAAETMYGYPAEEVIGRPLSEILTTHYFEFKADEVLERLSHHGTFQGRAVQTTARGDKYIIDASLAIVTDSDENLIGYVGVNRDVTQEQATQEERRRLVTILENTTDLVGTALMDGEITYLNQAGRKMLGLPLSGPITFNAFDAFSDDYKEIGAQGLKTAISDGTWTGEVMLISQSKEMTPVSMVMLSHKGESGEAAYFSAVARNISRQKYQERHNFLRMKMSQKLSEATTLDEVFETVADYGKLYPTLTISINEKLLDDHPHGQIHRIVMINHQNRDIFQVGNTVVYEPAMTQFLDQGQVYITEDMATDKTLTSATRRWAAENDIHNTVLFPLMVSETNRYGALVVTTSEAKFFDHEMMGQYQSLAEEITLAIRSIFLNREIHDSLERRSREVAITTRIAQEIATADNLLEIYEQVVKQVQESFGFYHTQILQYNPALDAVHLIVGYGETGQKMLEEGHQMPMGVGLIGVAAATGQSVLRPDVREDPSWQPNPHLPDTRGELAVPIKFQERVLGVLDIQADRANVLSEADQVVLEGLCGVIAVAIEWTFLRQDMAYRLEELDALQRSLSREGWRSLQQIGSQGYLYDNSVVRPLTDEAENQDDSQTDGLKTTSSAVLVSQPLAVRGEQIGAIALQDLPEKPLTREEQRLLSEISSQVAEALENARLFEQTQRRAAELETVAELSTTTATILEQEKLLKSVADLTKEGFGLEHVNIYLYRPAQKALVLTAGSGQVGELLMAENIVLPLSVKDATAVKVFETNTPFIRNQISEQVHPFLKKVKSLLCVPLAAGGELLGVIGLMANQINVFQQTDLPIFTTLANQVATSLQNASLYQEQKETAEKLIEVDRLKSEFLASMSHELRTPLNSIIGFADVLLEGIDGELNDRMTEDVMLIRDGGRHLRNLIGEILDMSKIEAGMMQLTYGPVDLQRVAKEVVATTSGLLTNKPVNLIQKIDEDVGVIEADRTRLIQILLNLLSNAAKFTDRGTITLSMQRDEEKKELLIQVKDSGVGIKEEDIPLVFEQFRQVGGMENRKAGGTGLGMPITKHLVELHGGKIWLESVYGTGTTFYIRLPYEQPVKPEGEGQRYYA